MIDETGLQKGIRLPRGRAPQEDKVAPEAVQHGLELNKARDRVSGGHCWLLAEVPWTVTEDCRREQPVLFSVLLPEP